MRNSRPKERCAKLFQSDIKNVRRNLSGTVIAFGILLYIAPEFAFRGQLALNPTSAILYAAGFIIWGLFFINPLFDKWTTNNYIWVTAPLLLHMLTVIVDITIINPSLNALPLAIIYGSYCYLVYILELGRAPTELDGEEI